MEAHTAALQAKEEAKAAKKASKANKKQSKAPAQQEGDDAEDVEMADAPADVESEAPDGEGLGAEQPKKLKKRKAEDSAVSSPNVHYISTL